MTDIAYSLDTKLSFDVTLAVTMGGGVVNTGKNLDTGPGDSIVLIYGDLILGAAPILAVAQRTKTTQEIAHGAVGALSPEQREISHRHTLVARGGSYWA